MNRILFVFSLLSLLFFTSCKKDKTPGVDFGTSKYYEPFLFSKSDTVILTKVLNYDFNDYAVEKESYIKIKWVDRDERNLTNPNVRFYVDGARISDNEFKINSTNQKGELELGIQFLPGYEIKKHTGYLVVSSHSLDVVDNIDLNNSNQKKLFQWKANYKVVMNPIKSFLMWFVIIVVGVLLFWLTVLRPIVFQRFGKRTLTIQSPFFMNIRLKSGVFLTLSNSSVKQKWYNKLLVGKKINYTHPFFDEPITITPSSKSTAFLSVGIAYQITPFITNLNPGFQVYTLTNLNTKQSITFVYN